MRARLLSVIVALLISGHSVCAEDATLTAVEITWFGIYTVSKPSKILQGPVISDGGIIPPTSNNDRIVLGRGIRFGFGYTLTGSPANGRVEVVSIFNYPSPGVFNEIVEKKAEHVLAFGDCEIGGKDCHVGFVVEDPKDLPAGVWTFQLFSNKKVWAEKRFTISLP